MTHKMTWKMMRKSNRTISCLALAAALAAGLVAAAVAIWTHVAGQTTAEAPSPLAFVAAIIHGVGAFYPPGGIGCVPQALASGSRRGRCPRRDGRQATTAPGTPPWPVLCRGRRS